MLELRWHSRAGQGAVTGAKGLASVIATTGKEVQAFAFYGSAKRGAAMTAYNRIDDKPIVNYEKYMSPDYVLVLDPALVHYELIIAHEKPNTKYILSTHFSKEEILKESPFLEGKEIYTVDCIKISQDTIGRAVPNAPMLGAFMKVSSMFEIEKFKEDMKKTLRKFPQKIIDANMEAISIAHDQVI